ncbi:MAG: apolipoprotein N-acyltransferase [Pseudomonadales bacterium]|nr:apolipoprotein N-acyltransferase [Pseudomonadales bacterium]
MRWRHVGLAALSGLFLALPFNDSSLFLLTWAGFVPLLVAMEHKTPAQSYRLGLICGLVLYGVGANWVVTFVEQLWSPPWPVTVLLSLLFWLYSAQLPALLMLAFQWLRQRIGWSDLLLFPLLATLFFAHFPMLFQAQLGESQSDFLVALQPLALTGVYGLDMLIALVNILLLRWLHQSTAPWRDRVGLLASLLPLAWMGYGVFELHHWEQRMASWTPQRVGLVQTNTPAESSGKPQPGHTLSQPRALALSRELARDGARLVVWPETGFDAYFSRSRVASALQQAAMEMNAALLLQGMETVGTDQFNSAALLASEGREAGHYRKIQRVAFGEYLPLLERFPQTGSRVREQLGGFFSRVSPGDAPARFASHGMELLPLICYEALFPALVANAARGGKAQELLVVLSNNAWFGASQQPFQHLNASVLRAVENRRPLLHVINNGPSAVILPTGQRLLETRYGEEAAYWVDIPLPSRLGDSVFTRHPHGFIGLLYLLLLAALVSGFRATRPLALSR